MLRLRWVWPSRPRLRWVVQQRPVPALLRSSSEAVLAAVFGPPGRAGGVTITRMAVSPISGHRVVRSVPEGCAYASADQASHADTILGISLGAASEGATVEIAVGDEITVQSWSWSAGPVFLGLNGVLVQPEPTDTAFVRQIGFAVAPDRLLLTPRPPVFIQQ